MYTLPVSFGSKLTDRLRMVAAGGSLSEAGSSRSASICVPFLDMVLTTAAFDPTITGHI